MRIGFAGLGVLGLPMALRLVAAGHSVAVFDPRPDRVHIAEETGAEAAGSAGECAVDADAVLLVPYDFAQVAGCCLGPGGVFERARPGAVVVVMATVAPDDVRRLGAAAEERRLALLDAALTGGVSGAEAGTLTAMVGGTDEALAACRPCFDATCGRVFHLGALGAGMTMKALNQMVFAGTFTALCEMAAVATRAGVDLKTAFEVLGTGVCDSWVLRSRAPAFVDGSYSTGARTAVLRKDLAIAQALARSVSQPIPVTATATQMFELAAGMGYDDTDDAHLLRALLGYRRE